MIQSLAFTIGLDAPEMDRFDEFRRKRSMSIYSAAGVITQSEAKEIQKFAKELLGRARSWLEDNHPDLLH